MYRLLLFSTESALSLKNYTHVLLTLTFPAGHFYKLPRILPAERPKIHKFDYYHLYQISNSPVKGNLPNYFFFKHAKHIIVEALLALATVLCTIVPTGPLAAYVIPKDGLRIPLLLTGLLWFFSVALLFFSFFL